jgi:NTP pyrophosphatase (non-canonical NTP hydrolase)
MDINKLSTQVENVALKYSKEYGIKIDSDWLLFKLQEELGELTQAYLMYSNRGRKKGYSKKKIREDFEKEFADVLSFVLLFAKFHNINFDKIIKEKWLSRLEK